MKTLHSTLAISALLGLLVLGSCDDSPTEPTPDCTSTVSPTSTSVSASGGSGGISISIADGCAWTAQSNASWLNISPASGTGAGSVTFTAAANTDTSLRTGTLTVATRTVTITQAGKESPSCTYDTTPDSASYTKDAGTGSVSVTAPNGCTWSASSDSSWLTITSGASGSGNGVVNYTVARNVDPAGRTAVLTAAGKTTTIVQQGDSGVCTYSVAPAEFTPCMPAFELTTVLTTQPECPWTATPDASWMSVSSQSGAGSASIKIAITANYDLPREGKLLVRWPTPTAGQNVVVKQAGCTYVLTAYDFNAPAAGGTSQFFVYQNSVPNECGGATQDRCIWSAVADVPWITISGSATRQGDDMVKFTVSQNTTGAPRSGTIVVRDQVFRVTQSGS